eukprot:4149422-Pyramimonas_sp.AAC.1
MGGPVARSAQTGPGQYVSPPRAATTEAWVKSRTRPRSIGRTPAGASGAIPSSPGKGVRGG